MAIPKICGIETEYGISVRGAVDFNPILTSSLLINAYAKPAFSRVRWDYEEESPLRDARGFDRSQPDAVVEDESGLVNIILPNGSRYYVDHAHPEYSSPECSNARDAVIWDKAGERILEDSIAAAQPLLRDNERVFIYKNNTDGKGASYGMHENYLVARATPFADIVRHLTPFFVSRQVVTGAGRVGIGADSRGAGFQLTQRSDFFEVEVGLETTLKRPIINTRDEPHADPEKYRRLHVIIGDANLAELSTYLKIGTTNLVLAMIEDGWLTQAGVDLTVDGPVSALRDVSHDPSLAHRLTLADGRRMTAVQLQEAYLEQARKHVEDRLGEDVDPTTTDVLDRWESVLRRLADDPLSLAGELDWPTKLSLLEGYRDREGLAWDAPKLALVDLQYADVRPDRGLYNRLVTRGSMTRLVGEDEVLRAVSTPPEDTRAWFRGRCIARYGADVAAASWDSVIFDVGKDSLQRVPTLEPLRGTRAHVGALIDECDTALALVEALTGKR